MSCSADVALKKAERIDVEERWFEVLRLPNDVYSIAEPHHWQEVISFLIIGSQKAALLDTGMGIRDISKVVGQLTELEVIVINSHTHFDHVGDNHRFSRILVYDDRFAVERLISGMPNEALQFDTRLGAFFDGYPEGFDPKGYEIHPVSREKIDLLCDGDVIDLGGRTMRVLHTPGHSPDSIMLLDHKDGNEKKSLFTGDTFYPDWLFAFLDEPFGKSDLQVYERTMRELTKLVPKLDYLYCSHNQPLVDPEVLYDVARAFEAVSRGETKYEHVELYDQELWLYDFDGFAIVTRKE
jgi:glyoxylase-like metal-dependent hydrolase (beta-lactamase superfamily II)